MPRDLSASDAFSAAASYQDGASVRKATSKKLAAVRSPTPGVERLPVGWQSQSIRELRAEAERKGIDPDSVSTAVLKMLVNQKHSPLSYLTELINKEGKDAPSASMKLAAAAAALPYMHPKSVGKSAATGGAGGGVMEVPIAASAKEWEALAAPMQDQLKKAAG